MSSLIRPGKKQENITEPIIGLDFNDGKVYTFQGILKWLSIDYHTSTKEITEDAEFEVVEIGAQNPPIIPADSSIKLIPERVSMEPVGSLNVTNKTNIQDEKG